jgi:hypothetical protein
MFNVIQLRRTSFIALLAIVMLSVAPTVSKVLAADHAGANLVEVCTVEGTKWLSSAEFGLGALPSHQGDPGQDHNHQSDCPFCSLQLAKFVLIASSSCDVQQAFSPLPPLFYTALKPLFAWAHSRSRAPPLVA